jgi:spoIIIJ-associated protein
MDFIEKEGLSLPEAVFSACKTLGIEEKEAQVQVLSAPGSRRVKVRVGRLGAVLPAAEALQAPAASAPAAAVREESAPLARPADYSPKASNRKQPSSAQAETARADLEKLLELMGTPSKVEVKEHAGNSILNITGEKEGLLIGKRGATLDALQDVMEAMLETATGDKDVYAVVDVADYRVRQEQKIMDRAREIAERVIKEGGQQSLGPLSPAERRLVHLVIKPMDGLESFSVGNGSMKKVVIQKKS